MGEPYEFLEYQKRIGFLNREVTLVLGENRVSAIPLFVEEDGALTVLVEGETKKVYAGEVSLLV